jgi:glutamyl-tRNA synthetase
MKFKKTRIAPTPSGYLHIGNVLSFSLTAGLARRTGASILLRIDDLDRERVDLRYVEDIFDTLRFLGIPWDEGPMDAEDFERNWSQMRRLSLYKEALDLLRRSGAVFACSCSRAQLASGGGYPGTCRDKGISLDAEGVNWRLRTEALRVGEHSGDGNLAEELPLEMRDFVVRKKDGFPAYQLSSVMDDLHFGVDLVVRGADLRPSTAAQLYLADALAKAGMPGADAFKKVQFIHHPLLMEGGEKLSKSAGAMSINYLRQQGASPAEIFNLIGRTPGAADLRI